MTRYRELIILPSMLSRTEVNTQRFLPADLKAGRRAYRRERTANFIVSLPGGNGFQLVERSNFFGTLARIALALTNGNKVYDHDIVDEIDYAHRPVPFSVESTLYSQASIAENGRRLVG